MKLNSARPTDVKAARDIRYDDGILLLPCISSHFFFLSANLRLSIIVCSSNAEHFAWLTVRVVLIEVCTIGVFNLRSLRLWFCHCSLVHGRLRSSFKNRKDQISFHQKMELMKENFSFSSGTCFYAFNLKKRQLVCELSVLQWSSQSVNLLL